MNTKQVVNGVEHHPFGVERTQTLFGELSRLGEIFSQIHSTDSYEFDEISLFESQHVPPLLV